jgi:hypothetical protein
VYVAFVKNSCRWKISNSVPEHVSGDFRGTTELDLIAGKGLPVNVVPLKPAGYVLSAKSHLRKERRCGSRNQAVLTRFDWFNRPCLNYHNS